MRIILYECKKILKLPLLVIIILFTLLFYNLFMNSQYYPNDDKKIMCSSYDVVFTYFMLFY